MTDQLHQRLADLAGEAPIVAGSDPGDVWRAGKRRQRRRTAAGALAACALVLAGIGGVGLVLTSGDRDPAPVTPPVSELHLPKQVHKPDPWSKGTGDLGEIGPLAAIGSAERFAVKGWRDKQQSYELYGVSAVDGTARFLDLGLPEEMRDPWDGPTTALSPDGTKVAFLLERSEVEDGTQPERAVGWGVYDTVTGRVTELADDEPTIATRLTDLVFTADSRYIVTTYGPAADAADNRSDSLVVWDTTSGERTVAEGPGKYWLPNIGSAPHGVLWARGQRVHLLDPETGERSSFRVPRAIVEASIGPDGEALAYIGGVMTPGPDGGIDADTWGLYVGTDRGHLRAVDGLRDGDLGYVVGWRDTTHVVIDSWDGRTVTVDVTSGRYTRGRLPDGNGRATLASDFLANPLVDGVRPPDAQDPRTWWRRSTYVGLPLALVGLVIWRRRERG